MRILCFSHSDQSGGAERVALDLHLAYLQAGHDSRLLVKHRRTAHPGVEIIPKFRATPAGRMLNRISSSVSSAPWFRGQVKAIDIVSWMGAPGRAMDWWAGKENFASSWCAELSFPGGWVPDVVHCHNLHGGFFDLNALGCWPDSLPVLWTLHDTWILTGHCGYYVDCQRWRTGCGHCPDLARYPGIMRDRTQRNLSEKQRALSRAKNLHLQTPSRWLLDLVSEAKVPSRSLSCIPYGIDLSIFTSGKRSRSEIRRELGLPAEKFIVLGSLASISATNPYKDPQMIAELARRLSRASDRFCTVLLGATDARLAGAPGLSLPGYIKQPSRLADYYRAADVFVHAAPVDNFPCAILEAQACGLPVVATSVGGIPEQIEHERTGLLVSRGDVAALEAGVVALSRDPAPEQWRERACRHARENFDRDAFAGKFLKLMKSLITNGNS